MSERDIYSVSRLNRAARLLLEAGLTSVWIEGEVSNFARPASGHWYFTLKDRDAQLRCAMFRQRNALSGFTPREGQLVLGRGRVTLYEPRGDYQLILEQVEEAGLGALKRAFELLKARLAAEGLFAVERKRALPAAPRRIGVITSPTGAALRDILHILARRFAAAEVIIYPTVVQGAAAAPAIAQAIELASRRAECDVLILARGGGSLEDLWAFNDEQVARALARCALPVISGIGHETDFTIADFVADVRAPTPSGAAQLAVPDGRLWLERLGRFSTRLGAAMQRRCSDGRTTLEHLRHRLALLHPGTRLAQQSQRLDELEQRLRRTLEERLRRAAARVLQGAARLRLQSPAVRIESRQLRYAALRQRLRASTHAQLARHTARLELTARALQAISPLATLGRGFALVTRAADGALLRSSTAVQPGEDIQARLAVGTLRARVLSRDPA